MEVKNRVWSRFWERKKVKVEVSGVLRVSGLIKTWEVNYDRCRDLRSYAGELFLW